jgi:uncharacterized protein (TIGR01777 family)
VARIAILGSSGHIGTALRERLGRAGHEVIRIRRGKPDDPGATWDPAAGWFRAGALEGVDAVVNLAGANIGEKRWTEARKRLIFSSRIDGTRLLVDHLAMLTSKPAVLVCASAVGYYGSRRDEVLTEESAPGEGFLADLCQRWEAEARRAEGLGIRVVSIRTAPMVDAGEGMLQRMLPPFRLGLGGKIGKGKAWLSFITKEDIARVYEFAISSGLQGPVNAMEPNPVTNAEFTKAFGRAIHRPTVMPLPPAGLKALYGGQMVDEMLTASVRAVPKRLADAGFEFQHPTIDAALAAALR